MSYSDTQHLSGQKYEKRKVDNLKNSEEYVEPINQFLLLIVHKDVLVIKR